MYKYGDLFMECTQYRLKKCFNNFLSYEIRFGFNPEYISKFIEPLQLLFVIYNNFNKYQTFILKIDLNNFYSIKSPGYSRKLFTEKIGDTRNIIKNQLSIGVDKMYPEHTNNIVQRIIDEFELIINFYILSDMKKISDFYILSEMKKISDFYMKWWGRDDF